MTAPSPVIQDCDWRDSEFILVPTGHEVIQVVIGCAFDGLDYEDPEVVYHGETDGKTIWVESRQSEREKHLTILHETLHVLAGHGTPQPSWLEDEIERIAQEAYRSLEALGTAGSGGVGSTRDGCGPSPDPPRLHQPILGSLAG